MRLKIKELTKLNNGRNRYENKKFSNSFLIKTFWPHFFKLTLRHEQVTQASFFIFNDQNHVISH